MANDVLVQEEQEIQTARDDSSKIINKAMELAKNIRDAVSMNSAADFLLEIKRKRKWWSEFNKPSKQKLDALKRELLDRERQIDEPMERAENEILKPAMVKYQTEQDRKRKEEEDRLRAEAKKKEEDARIKDAEALVADGQKELADAIMAAPVVVAPVVVPREDSTPGISYREIWKFEVIDPNSVPRDYLAIDEKRIGGVVRALKGETRIPGVRVWPEKSIAGRS